MMTAGFLGLDGPAVGGVEVCALKTRRTLVAAEDLASIGTSRRSCALSNAVGVVIGGWCSWSISIYRALGIEVGRTTSLYGSPWCVLADALDESKVSTVPLEYVNHLHMDMLVEDDTLVKSYGMSISDAQISTYSTLAGALDVDGFQ